MQKQRRRTIRRFIERAALVVAALDIVIYAAVVRPLHAHVVRTEEAFDQVRLATLKSRANVARLERERNLLPQTDQDLKAFLASHVPSRRWGFSEAERLVRRLTDKSNVQLASVDYKLRSGASQPLDRLGVQVTVTGAFPDLLKFSRSIETASDLILVRDFSFTAGGAHDISLRVDADLYLTP
jgi:Tfp pilus assembly protein PilO